MSGRCVFASVDRPADAVDVHVDRDRGSCRGRTPTPDPHRPARVGPSHLSSDAAGAPLVRAHPSVTLRLPSVLIAYTHTRVVTGDGDVQLEAVRVTVAGV